MATTKNDYLSTKPTDKVIQHKDVRIPKMSTGAYLAANKIAEMFEKNVFPRIGFGHPYVAAQWTVDTAGTGGAVAESSVAGGGILLTTASDAAFNNNHQSVQIWTPAAGKIVSCWARVTPNDVDKIGFKIGIGDAQADPFATNYTDCVVISKAVATGIVTGAVRGNSGTQAVSGTLVTMTDASTADLGFWFSIGTSATVGTAGAWYCNGTWTGFTAAQCVQLFAILTTPPSVYFNVNATGTTGGNYTLQVIAAACEVDN